MFVYLKMMCKMTYWDKFKLMVACFYLAEQLFSFSLSSQKSLSIFHEHHDT